MRRIFLLVLAAGCAGAAGVPRSQCFPSKRCRRSCQFRYRVAPDHVESGEERHLRETAAKILAAYRVRRAKYIGKDKPGVLALIRDWYDDGEGLCAPSNAKVQ